MSKVTNLILTCSVGEDEGELIKQFSNFKYGGKEFKITSLDDSSWGTKRLECIIFVGVYNHFPLSDFINFLKKDVNWYDLERVQLFVKEQNDDLFSVLNLYSP
ncbi:MAG: hypothetical protein QM781_13050 [Chitinophagaceae bacterium]